MSFSKKEIEKNFFFFFFFFSVAWFYRSEPKPRRRKMSCRVSVPLSTANPARGGKENIDRRKRGKKSVKVEWDEASYLLCLYIYIYIYGDCLYRSGKMVEEDKARRDTRAPEREREHLRAPLFTLQGSYLLSIHSAPIIKYKRCALLIYSAFFFPIYNEQPFSIEFFFCPRRTLCVSGRVSSAGLDSNEEKTRFKKYPSTIRGEKGRRLDN